MKMARARRSYERSKAGELISGLTTAFIDQSIIQV